MPKTASFEGNYLAFSCDISCYSFPIGKPMLIISEVAQGFAVSIEPTTDKTMLSLNSLPTHFFARDCGRTTAIEKELLTAGY